MSTPENYRNGLPSPEIVNKPDISFGNYLPANILTNEEIESWNVKTASGKKLTAKDIEDRVGVKFRYVAGEKEIPLFMGLAAAQEAYRNNPGKIDAVIVTTNFPTGQNLSAEIAKELSISGFNMDVYAACSGFGLSLHCVKEREEEFLGKRILFVATEKITPYLQNLKTNVRKDGTLKDSSLAQTIFSDGAVALLTEYGKGMKVIFSSTHTFPDEDSNETIKMPVDKTLLKEPYYFPFPAPFAESGTIEQDGKRVYELMRITIPNLVSEVVQKANLKPSDFESLDCHQGSGHIVEILAKRLPEFSVSKDYQHGNLSSGAVLEILRKANLNNKIKIGDKRLVAVFGAGLLAVIAGLEFG